MLVELNSSPGCTFLCYLYNFEELSSGLNDCNLKVLIKFAA